MNTTTTRAIWLDINPSNKENTIADAINNWCTSNPNVEIESVEVFQEHEVKYKALIMYRI